MAQGGFYYDHQGQRHPIIDEDHPLGGYGAPPPDDINPIVSAFNKRAYLVELAFEEGKFVVAIANIEDHEPAVRGKAMLIETPQQALDLAQKRAKSSIKTLGDLISSRVLPDCSESREELGVSGPKTRTEYSDLWTEAA
jgi:hypothetical protein